MAAVVSHSSALTNLRRVAKLPKNEARSSKPTRAVISFSLTIASSLGSIGPNKSLNLSFSFTSAVVPLVLIICPFY